MMTLGFCLTCHLPKRMRQRHWGRDGEPISISPVVEEKVLGLLKGTRIAAPPLPSSDGGPTRHCRCTLMTVAGLTGKGWPKGCSTLDKAPILLTGIIL